MNHKINADISWFLIQKIFEETDIIFYLQTKYIQYGGQGRAEDI